MHLYCKLYHFGYDLQKIRPKLTPKSAASDTLASAPTARLLTRSLNRRIEDPPSLLRACLQACQATALNRSNRSASRSRSGRSLTRFGASSIGRHSVQAAAPRHAAGSPGRCRSDGRRTLHGFLRAVSLSEPSADQAARPYPDDARYRAYLSRYAGR